MEARFALLVGPADVGPELLEEYATTQEVADRLAELAPERAGQVVLVCDLATGQSVHGELARVQ